MILCCGEALIDMLPYPIMDANKATGYIPHAGGSVFNTAIAIGRLGVPTSFFSGLSSDFFGELLKKTLAEAGVATDLCVISDLPTTLAFVQLENGQASYLFYDENSAGRMLHERDLPQLDDEITTLHFGAISLINEPCGSTYEALMRREAKQRVIMIDPNIRPDFIHDKVSHLARMQRMMALSDIVKLSDEDLIWFGLGSDHAAVANSWLAKEGQSGPKLIVITKGAAGADAYTRDGKVSVNGIDVTVADTVGAGDTLSAGLLVSLEHQGLLDKASIASLTPSQIRACVSYGVEAAAITVSRAGANPPWANEMPKL